MFTPVFITLETVALVESVFKRPREGSFTEVIHVNLVERCTIELIFYTMQELGLNY